MIIRSLQRQNETVELHSDEQRERVHVLEQGTDMITALNGVGEKGEKLVWKILQNCLAKVLGSLN